MLKIEDLKFDEKGLIPAIVVDAVNGKVLTLAYMNKEIKKFFLCGRIFIIRNEGKCGRGSSRRRHRRVVRQSTALPAIVPCLGQRWACRGRRSGF